MILRSTPWLLADKSVDHWFLVPKLVPTDVLGVSRRIFAIVLVACVTLSLCRIVDFEVVSKMLSASGSAYRLRMHEVHVPESRPVSELPLANGTSDRFRWSIGFDSRPDALPLNF